MKVTFSVGRAIIEADGEGTKDCFDQLSAAAEIFGVSQCGLCESREIVPITREYKGYTFHEWKCTSCGASLGLGSRKSDGQLFPKTKEGWKKWSNTNPADDSNEEPF